MSSLLRRLAAAQLGTGAPRLRPESRLPYHGSPPGMDAATDADPALPVSTRPAEAIQPASAAGGRPPVAPSPGTGEHPPTTGPAAPRSGPPTATDTSATTGVIGAPHPPTPHSPAPPPLLASRTDAAPAAPAARPAAATPDPEEAPAAPAAAPRGQDSAPAQAPHALAPASHAAPPALMPATGGPDTASQGRARHGAPASAGSPRADAMAGAPDEVHIHIGRIEVSAVQEAPQPKARARRGQAPMSLDDYLARRQRGGT
jgi:hypothetical protein